MMWVIREGNVKGSGQYLFDYTFGGVPTYGPRPGMKIFHDRRSAFRVLWDMCMPGAMTARLVRLKPKAVPQ